jgi:hypothetical protein
MSWKDLYSEVKKRKMEALNKQAIVKAVEKHGKILAIEGKFERAEEIIKNMYVSEYKIIKYEKKEKRKKQTINEILNTDFNAYDVILIGCPGDDIPFAGHHKIHDYVANHGGWIITTDWAIKFIIEVIFPGYMRWNKNNTSDTVVACQIQVPSHPFLDGVLSEIQQSKWMKDSPKNTKKTEFRWWLEYRSFPIEILNPNEVHVLIHSREIEQRWGNGPVLVYFDYGKTGGRVIHMISHTHLQKGEAKGKYASALILSNIVDEKVAQKIGVSKETSSQYISDWQSATNPLILPHKSLENQWIEPTSDNHYLTPSTPEGSIGLTSTSQIIEVNYNNFNFNNKCAYCNHDFINFSDKIYLCKECRTPYHDKCLNLQINEGVCKNCGRILLW